MKNLLLLSSFALAFQMALWGCSVPYAGSTDNPIELIPPTKTLRSVEPASPQPTLSLGTPISSPESTPEPSLSPTGPWLLLRFGDELFVSNNDGSAVVHLDLLDLWTDWSNTCVPSPDGGRVAVKDRDGELLILKLPEGSTTLVAPLINPDIEVTDDQHSFWEDVYASIYYLPNMAWSSFGDMLSFVAMSDGVTPDIYLLDFATGQIERLTTGDTIALIPEWSPTSEYIVHDAVTSVHWGRSGRGYSVHSVWIAHPDGSIPFRLFESEIAPDKGFEHRLGWLSDTVYIASTEPEWCNQTSLRTESVTGAPSVPLWEGSFYDAVFDPNSQTVLLFIPLEKYQWLNPGCLRSEAPGFYLLNLKAGTKSMVEGLDLESFSNPTISWSPNANRFLIENEKHVYTVDPSGKFEHVTTIHLGSPHISRDGQYWALLDLDEYPNSGVVLMTPDGHMQEIFPGEIGSLSWSPDSTHLFFTGKTLPDDDFYDLYVASSPTFIPENLSTRFALPGDWRMSFLTWVNP